MKEKNIYFQSSLPRSGSTLLQNILGQNPKFYVTPTSGVLELLYSSREQYSTSPEFKAQNKETMKKGFQFFCKYGMQGFYNAITDKPIVIDKSRGWGVHYDFISTFIDDPKIICMVRDPREIYTSMEKNFRKNPEMSKNIVNWSTGQGVNIEKRVELWSKTVPVGLAFTRLKEIIDTGIDKKILFVRYEDLLNHPNKVMEHIYSYLGEENYVHNFENIAQLTQEDDTVYGHYGDHSIQPKLIDLKFQAYDILGPTVCDDIAKSYQWFYKYFNYI